MQALASLRPDRRCKSGVCSYEHVGGGTADRRHAMQRHKIIAETGSGFATDTYTKEDQLQAAHSIFGSSSAQQGEGTGSNTAERHLEVGGMRWIVNGGETEVALEGHSEHQPESVVQHDDGSGGVGRGSRIRHGSCSVRQPENVAESKCTSTELEPSGHMRLSLLEPESSLADQVCQNKPDMCRPALPKHSWCVAQSSELSGLELCEAHEWSRLAKGVACDFWICC
jgi:hypothetical protein